MLRQSPTIPEVAKRYIDRINRICETQNVELIIFCKELEKRNKLLNRYKNHKKNKRIKLNVIPVYNTEQVLVIAREKKVKKKSIDFKQPRKRPIKELKK